MAQRGPAPPGPTGSLDELESAVVSNGALEPIAAQAEWNREYRDDTGESALTETLLQTRVFQLEQENKNYKVN